MAAEFKIGSSRRPNVLLEKLDRVEPVFKEESDVPEIFFKNIEEQKNRLKAAIETHGKDDISPFDF